ncbi:MAG: MotA/TolQ/ExbB proton channel family protein [Pirellulales bacterium]
METLTEILGYVIYGAQALTAAWGLYCAIAVWRRVAQSRFRNEDEQSEFLAEIEQGLSQGNFDGVAAHCEDDSRVLPQLIGLAVANRNLGYAKIRQLVADRFQRDVLSEIEYRLSWVLTVTKTAPMLGLFGTVGGMMGAFRTLGGGDKIDAATLANNISLALVTTVIGLAVAIPLMVIVAALNVRIKKLEELVGLGLSQFLEMLKPALDRVYRRGA